MTCRDFLMATAKGLGMVGNVTPRPDCHWSASSELSEEAKDD
jgi:hypothetical protein